jgi:hypothetical protein
MVGRPVEASSPPGTERPHVSGHTLASAGQIALLVAAPLILYLINNSWTFVIPRSWIDAFLYTSYFLELRDNIDVFGINYYTSRLPWVLFGHVTYALLPDEAANLSLRFVLVYGSMLGSYVAVWATWRAQTAATLTALLVCTNTAFLWSARWDYVDGAGITQLLLALGCLSLAASGTRPAVWSFAGGVLALTALSTNIVLVLPVALLVSWLAGVTWITAEGEARAVLERLTWMAAGAVVAFVFFGLLNVYLGGDFNYLLPQIEAARTLDPSTYTTPPLKGAGWVLFPLVVAAGALSLLARVAVLYRAERRTPDAGTLKATLAALLCLIMLGAWLFAQFALDRPLLNFAYYANFVLPFSFLALGGIIAVSKERSAASATRSLALVAAALVVVVLPFIVDPLDFAASCPQRCLDWQPMLLLAVTVGSSLAILVWDRSLAAGAIVVALYAMLNVGSADRGAFEFDRGRRGHFEQMALLRFDAASAIRDQEQRNDTFIWYGETENFGPIFTEIASMHMWNLRLAGSRFPQHIALPSGTRVVIATQEQRDTVLARANETLRSENRHAVLETEMPVRRGRHELNLFFVRIAEGPGSQ